MIKTRKRTKEEIQYWQDIHRSSAASPHKNKTKYNRKEKHRDRAYV